MNKLLSIVTRQFHIARERAKPDIVLYKGIATGACKVQEVKQTSETARGYTAYNEKIT